MEISYRDYQVMTVPAPIGGQTLLETLNILENFDTQSLGHNTSDYLHLFIECARHAFADRYRFMGDWEVAKVPIEGLLSKEYAEEISSHVDLERAALEPGIDEEPWVYYIEKAIHDPWKYDSQTRPSGESFSASADGSGTTHFNAVDKDRNIVCCTHFGGFGDGGIPPGTGLYLNGHMGQLIPKAGHPNSVEGWKRPMTNDSPVMVLEEGRPILCIGAPGGRRIINRITQILLSVLDFSMGIQDACAAPTVDASSMQTVVDSRIPSETIGRLKAMGHRIRPVVSGPRVAEFARPSGILIDHETRLLKGGVEVFAAAVALGH
jgi:gamma-glutamyltranspeptidase/glutathione hydrolase